MDIKENEREHDLEDSKVLSENPDNEFDGENNPFKEKILETI
jgi:hypothetical protein